MDAVELAELGKLAIASEEARRRRVSARKARQDRVREWHQENGEDLDSRYHEDTLSKEFIAFTAETMAEYKAATNAAIAARHRVIRAVARITNKASELSAKDGGVAGNE